MKGIKKKLSERGEIYLTVSFGFVTPMLWKRVKWMVYAKKNKDCCDSFNEITFQIEWLSDYTNYGGLIGSDLCKKKRTRV